VVFSHALCGLVVLAVSVTPDMVSSWSSHMPCVGSLFSHYPSRLSWSLHSLLTRLHQEKKSASGRTGCIQTHQALGTLWTHPGRAHTASITKRTGNVNSDAARHGTVHSDAVCQGAVHLDAARHGTVHSDALCQGPVHPDAARHGICLPDGACQGIFLLDAALSGHFPTGRSRVRAFSFGMQPCQSIFLRGAAVSG